jgi:hypothetical protein
MDEDEANEPDLEVGKNGNEAHRKKQYMHHSFDMTI